MGEHRIFKKRSVMVAVALFCCLLWGSAFPGIKLSYRELAITGEFEKLLLAGMRFTLAGLMVLAFAAVRNHGRLRPARRERPLILGVALLQTFGCYLTYYIALGYTSGVKGSILTSVSVSFVAILSHFMLKNDKLNARKILGLVLGFAGVVLVNVTLLHGAAFTFTFIGEGFLIIHAALIAVSTVLIRKYGTGIDVIRINGWQLLIGGLLLVAVGFAGHPHMLRFNALATGLLIYMAALSAIAFSLWFMLLQYHNASAVAQFKFAVPLFGSLMSVLFVPGEHIGMEALAAALLVAAGIIIVNRQDRRGMSAAEPAAYSGKEK